jgi:hypothetical protein
MAGRTLSARSGLRDRQVSASLFDVNRAAAGIALLGPGRTLSSDRLRQSAGTPSVHVEYGPQAQLEVHSTPGRGMGRVSAKPISNDSNR